MTLLIKGESGTLHQLIAYCGVESIKLRIIPAAAGTMIIDLPEDQFYLIVNTGKKTTEMNDIYVVKATGTWSKVIAMIQDDSSKPSPV